MVERVIIDTDPGTDDAIALMMVLNHPGVEVLALTTVGGNGALRHTTRNALCILEHMGRGDIPVFRGAARPLRGRFIYGYHFHGPGAMTAKLPPPARGPLPNSAYDYVSEATRRSPGELTLIALGPLTTVARVIRRDPAFAKRLKRLVVMGGAVETPGNVTPYAEFNIYNDPEAAQLVLSSGLPVTLVGLDVCDPVFVVSDDDRWARGGSRAEQLTRSLTDGWFALHDEGARYTPCDAMAVLAITNPELFGFRQASVRVETEDEKRRGQTVARYSPGSVRVATDVRAGAAMDAISKMLGAGS